MSGFLVAAEGIQFFMQVVGSEILLILSVPLLALLSMPLPFTVSITTGHLPFFKPRVRQKPTSTDPAGTLARRPLPHRLFSLLSCEKTTLRNIVQLVHQGAV